MKLHIHQYILIMQARHKTFLLSYNEAQVKVSSDFDSGNLQQASIVNNKLILTPALDPMHPQYSIKPSSKTFFHFKILSNTTINVNIVIEKMKILEYFPSQNFEEMYRVCLGKKHKKSWQSFIAYEKVKPKSMKRVQNDGSFQLHFQLELQQQEEVYLAYHFPYPFQKSQQFLHQIKERINNLNVHHNTNIYFMNQLLINTIEGRPVNLLTLTDGSTGKIQQQEARISKSVFPFFQLEGRPKKFNKPYVFLTCRVHSGETSSSYALEGVINFLLSQDKQSNLLLKNFVFLIVPILNPDGVFHGTYRMDTMGHNLNRFYNSAQSHKQPSIFAVQALACYYGNRILFFMDFHSHPHPNKGSFIYGNSMPNIEEQTETQLFAKILSFSSQCFGYNASNFSSLQMNSRDMNQLMTKDGSARVQLYKILGIPFAYTMEMGYHGCPLKEVSPETSIFSGQYKREQKIFTIKDYIQHGKSIMITLLKMFLLSSSKVQKNNEMKVFQHLREQICKELVEKEERFRQMDSFVFKKIKTINETLYDLYYHEIFKKYPAIEHNLKDNLHSDDILLRLTPISQQEQKESNCKKAVMPQKRGLSLKLQSLSRTIQNSPDKDFVLRPFKSTIEPRKQLFIKQNSFLTVSREKNLRFAKQLNLNFNPFPQLQRKKMYNMIGNNRSKLKKNLMNEIEFKEHQLFDIDTIDLNSQFQKAEGSFSKEEKDILRSYRLNCFSPKHDEIYNEEEQQKYNDTDREQDNDITSFALPKIPTKSQRNERQFDFEAQLAKQYDKKYKIKQMKRISPTHIKSSLRSNSLRTRTLVKSLK